MVKIFENDLVKTAYHADLKLISFTWKDKSFTFEEYKEPFEVSLDFHRDKDVLVYNFLSDLRNQKVVPPHFRKWFQDVAIQRAIKQGLKRAGVVMSGNVFKKYYINNC